MSPTTSDPLVCRRFRFQVFDQELGQDLSVTVRGADAQDAFRRVKRLYPRMRLGNCQELEGKTDD